MYLYSGLFIIIYTSQKNDCATYSIKDIINISSTPDHYPVKLSLPLFLVLTLEKIAKYFYAKIFDAYISNIYLP
jgi:hypothetical protein